ncbi:MAG: transposase [Flavobacteriales bacterium Tduv]
MMLLSHWYDINDIGTEELVKESLSCTSFCVFRLEGQTQYHTTLCRFRNEVIAKKAYKSLV